MTQTIDELSASDPIVKMNSGPGQTLEDVARELIDELGLTEDRVRPAADKIGAFTADVQTAQEPQAVVAGRIGSWYLGPMAEAQNWPTLEGILRGEAGATTRSETWMDRPRRSLRSSRIHRDGAHTTATAWSFDTSGAARRRASRPGSRRLLRNGTRAA